MLTLHRAFRFSYLLLLFSLTTTIWGQKAVPAKGRTTAPPQLPRSQVQGTPAPTTPEQVVSQVGAQLASQVQTTSNYGDYIPCEFTLEELRNLQPVRPKLTLSYEESEQLKVSVTNSVLEYSSRLPQPVVTFFITKLEGENFEGRRPSEALAHLIALLEYSLNQKPEAGPSTTPQARAPGQTDQSQSQSQGKAQGQTQSLGEATIKNEDIRRSLEEENRKASQAIVDIARTALAKMKRPDDVGCAMSILSWNETRHAFGHLIADEYIGVQIIVRNLNEKKEFLLHDAELAVNPDNERFGRFFSGRDKVVVRGLSLAQSDFSRRNLIVHIAESIGGVMSAMIPVAGTNFADAAGVYNGGFLPGLRRTYADHGIEQLNLLNDVGFSSTINANSQNVVPKSGTVMFVIFVPSKQFETGWWTQDCANVVVIKSKPTENTPGSTLSRDYKPPAGLDVAAALAKCAQDSAEIPVDNLNVKILGKPVPRHYSNWTPTASALFRELTIAVVSGTHIEDVRQNTPVLGDIDCPRDPEGNIDLTAAQQDSLNCTLTGQNLDKVHSLKLHNAEKPTDSLTGEGVVSVSGDNTTGTAAFNVKQLGLLTGTSYRVYTVTKDGIEEGGKITVHTSQKPSLTDIKPGSAAPGDTLTLIGFHLDKVKSILFAGQNETQLASKPSSFEITVVVPKLADNPSVRLSLKTENATLDTNKTLVIKAPAPATNGGATNTGSPGTTTATAPPAAPASGSGSAPTKNGSAPTEKKQKEKKTGTQ